ncbi:hypothetical protein MmiEs2_08650 [Methanimicrococcus stummii]|uniref:Uncharacterized protein n=1 Tax=Methanimicrococcus stummii TaxID=3028294 RepID=A0AA96V8G6_9EURY|nr:hypothetical protein MmiEs2_08650 [Methanimicrococcus sp. Es2]
MIFTDFSKNSKINYNILIYHSRIMKMSSEVVFNNFFIQIFAS